MARVPKRKIRIRRGDTYTHTVTEYDDTGSLSNLVGNTFLSQIRPDSESDTVIATFTTTTCTGQMSLESDDVEEGEEDEDGAETAAATGGIHALGFAEQSFMLQLPPLDFTNAAWLRVLSSFFFLSFFVFVLQLLTCGCCVAL